ncbi:hypothetical protein HK405_006943 [Cladochytrium tenue]|nr:hypothetical protein HK405_006943 [Cladochytrium tenue]
MQMDKYYETINEPLKPPAPLGAFVWFGLLPSCLKEHFTTISGLDREQIEWLRANANESEYIGRIFCIACASTRKLSRNNDGKFGIDPGNILKDPKGEFDISGTYSGPSLSGGSLSTRYDNANFDGSTGSSYLSASGSGSAAGAGNKTPNPRMTHGSALDVAPMSAIATVELSFNNSDDVWTASEQSGEKRWFYVNNPDKIATVTCQNIPPGIRIVADLVRNVGILSGRAQSDHNIINGIEVQSAFISGSEDTVIKLRKEDRVYSRTLSHRNLKWIFYPFQIRLAVLKKESDSEDYALVEAVFSRFFFMSPKKYAVHPEFIDWGSLRDCEQRFAGVFRSLRNSIGARHVRIEYPDPRMRYHLTFEESDVRAMDQDIAVNATNDGASAAVTEIQSHYPGATILAAFFRELHSQPQRLGMETPARESNEDVPATSSQGTSTPQSTDTMSVHIRPSDLEVITNASSWLSPDDHSDAINRLIEELKGIYLATNVFQTPDHLKSGRFVAAVRGAASFCFCGIAGGADAEGGIIVGVNDRLSSIQQEDQKSWRRDMELQFERLYKSIRDRQIAIQTLMSKSFDTGLLLQPRPQRTTINGSLARLPGPTGASPGDLPTLAPTPALTSLGRPTVDRRAPRDSERHASCTEHPVGPALLIVPPSLVTWLHVVLVPPLSAGEAANGAPTTTSTGTTVGSLPRVGAARTMAALQAAVRGPIVATAPAPRAAHRKNRVDGAAGGQPVEGTLRHEPQQLHHQLQARRLAADQQVQEQPRCRCRAASALIRKVLHLDAVAFVGSVIVVVDGEINVFIEDSSPAICKLAIRTHLSLCVDFSIIIIIVVIVVIIAVLIIVAHLVQFAQEFFVTHATQTHEHAKHVSAPQRSGYRRRVNLPASNFMAVPDSTVVAAVLSLCSKCSN